MLMFIHYIISKVVSIYFLAWWNIWTYITIERSLDFCLGKRLGHKAVKKSEGNIFFSLIYEVVTLELEVKIGLEKLEVTELTCEEAPCKQCVFSKLLAPSSDRKQITEENRSKLFSFTCEKCMLQELGLNRQKYCLLFIIIKSYWEEDLHLLNIFPTITRPWILVCMYMIGEGVIYALLSKPKKHKIITSYRVSSLTPTIWGRGLEVWDTGEKWLDY